MIATGSFDNSVKIWDILNPQSFKPVQILDDFKDSVTKVIFSDTQIICSSVDGYIRTYDIRMGKLLKDNIVSPINYID